MTKTDWEKECKESLSKWDNVHTERGAGRKISTGDGRETIKDRS
jgi:hypothetical protein